MNLGGYVTAIEAAALDLDAQADRAEERRRADVEWHLEIARWVAADALRVVRDEARNEWERLGYASAAVETIAGHRRAAA
jgi:hypothetical protein